MVDCELGVVGDEVCCSCLKKKREKMIARVGRGYCLEGKKLGKPAGTPQIGFSIAY